MHSPCAIGFGTLVFDQILCGPRAPLSDTADGNRTDATYEGGRGGGSVWNVLASLATKGFSCTAAGWGGDDLFGRLAASELSGLGIDISPLHLDSKQATRVIFEVLGGGGRRDHLFTERCPLCRTRYRPRRTPRVAPTNGRDRTKPCLLIVDDLNRPVTWDLLLSWRVLGDVTAAVLDHPSSYRYTPISKVVDKLQSVDVIFTKDRVFDSFRGRAAKSGIGDLYEVLRPQHRARLVVSTKGAAGADVSVCSLGGEWLHKWISAPDVAEPLDTSGAGDAFFSEFLATYFESGDWSNMLSGSEADVGVIKSCLDRAAAAIAPVLMSCGARGHLPPVEVPAPLIQNMGKSLHELEQGDHNVCPLCLKASPSLEPRKKDSRTVGMRETGGRFLRSRALFSLESSPLAEATKLLDEASTTYVVGTGGSYPAATFIAYALSAYGNHHAEAIKPHDLIARGGRVDTIIIVSASGKTVDCARALESALKKGTRRAVLITAAENPRLAQNVKHGVNLQVLRIRGKDRGFVSFAGTVNPAVIFAVASGISPLDAVRYCERDDASVARFSAVIAEKLSLNPVVHVIGTTWAWPALLDLESKFTEGNLGTIHLHEAKDFSHGRFMRVLGADRGKVPILFFRTGEKDRYADFMARKLKSVPDFHVITSDAPAIGGALDLMFQTQRLILEIAGRLAVDVSRPKSIPAKGLELYHWS